MRHELKYLVPLADADRLRRAVQPHCDLDRYALGRENDAYTVRSIYLESPQGAIYTHKVEGLRSRVKVRVRGYDDVTAGSRVGLELKRKRGDLSWKTRSHATLREAARWLAAPASDRATEALFGARERDAASQFHYVVTRYTLRPLSVVTYEREPYVGRHDPTLRVTFDMNLRGGFVGSLLDLGCPCVSTVFDRHLILEVKFDYHRPLWLLPVLDDLGLTRRALSKYVLVVDAAARAAHRSPRHAFTRLRSAGLGRAAFPSTA